MNIAIIDRFGQLVGWTDTAPTVVNGRLTHPIANELLGPEITSFNIEINNPEDAARAGAPPGWKGGWGCLAICPLGYGSLSGFANRPARVLAR